MSMKSVLKQPLLALAAVLALAGCSNETDNSGMLSVFKQSLPSIGKKAAPAAPVDIAAVMKNTQGPVTVIRQKNQANTPVPIIQIETNGAYRTYATGSRQSLTFRQGLVTATRGLGNDLMSSVTSESLALIAARREGTAKRELRYLDGQNDIFVFSFECQIFVTGSGHVRQGTVSAPVTEMTENCVAPTRKFTNTYKVDRSGMILSSQQWISPYQGYFDIDVMRR